MIALAQELAEIKQRLAEAEEQLRRNSQNSSQPPSQDQPGHAPGKEDGSVLKARQRGGQRGHTGHHRALLETV
jgi:transposase